MPVRSADFEQIVRMKHDRKMFIKGAEIVEAVVVHEMVKD